MQKTNSEMREQQKKPKISKKSKEIAGRNSSRQKYNSSMQSTFDKYSGGVLFNKRKDSGQKYIYNANLQTFDHKFDTASMNSISVRIGPSNSGQQPAKPTQVTPSASKMKKKTKAKPAATSFRSKRPTSFQLTMRPPLTTANYPLTANTKIPKVKKDTKAKSLTNRAGKLLADSLLKPPVSLPHQMPQRIQNKNLNTSFGSSQMSHRSVSALLTPIKQTRPQQQRSSS